VVLPFGSSMSVLEVVRDDDDVKATKGVTNGVNGVNGVNGH